MDKFYEMGIFFGLTYVANDKPRQKSLHHPWHLECKRDERETCFILTSKADNRENEATRQSNNIRMQYTSQSQWQLF